MKRKWRMRKWRTSDRKYRLLIGEDYLEKVKMSGENLNVSGPCTIQRRHFNMPQEQNHAYYYQLQDHYWKWTGQDFNDNAGQNQKSVG